MQVPTDTIGFPDCGSPAHAFSRVTRHYYAPPLVFLHERPRRHRRPISLSAVWRRLFSRTRTWATATTRPHSGSRQLFLSLEELPSKGTRELL